MSPLASPAVALRSPETVYDSSIGATMGANWLARAKSDSTRVVSGSSWVMRLTPKVEAEDRVGDLARRQDLEQGGVPDGLLDRSFDEVEPWLGPGDQLRAEFTMGQACRHKLAEDRDVSTLDVFSVDLARYLHELFETLGFLKRLAVATHTNSAAVVERRKQQLMQTPEVIGDQGRVETSSPGDLSDAGAGIPDVLQ